MRTYSAIDEGGLLEVEKADSKRSSEDMKLDSTPGSQLLSNNII